MSSEAKLPLRRPTVVLNEFEIYESKARLYIVGSNESEGYYRVLRIDRTASDVHQMVDDDSAYTRDEVRRLVAGARAGSMRLVVSGVCGILGFVRFTKGYYVSLVIARKPVALLGGHYVYHVEDTRLLSIAYRPERSDAEERSIARFKNVDLTKNFYYSHTYDITHTLQRNVHMWRRRDEWQYQSMFVWNYQLICNATQGIGLGAEWTVALIHGYVDQSKLSIFGRDVYITLIARRSRIFAGVRYLKRGVNDAGYVANDVETEQIVNTMEVTSFDMPYGRPFSNPGYTSYVQHRGSIPLFWSQETSGIAPKPPIEINVRDPYFVEAGRHFDSLFHRYGTPVIVLNLIKTKERTKRESVLGEEFSEGLHYLNQFLPRGKKIRYLAWDMSRAKKNRQEDVLAILEVIAEETLTLTGFFHNGSELYSNYLKRRAAGDARAQRKGVRCQTGIVRSNCIDCLDRTNAAQSIIGKVVLAHQLFELGQIDEPVLSFNTDAAMMIEEMYHDLGNTIALQYGGSHLVNTVQTYRRSTNWRSHSRDIVESLRRYYSNSLLDVERQEAITHFVEKSIFPECCPATAQLAPTTGDALFDDGDFGRVVSRPNQVGKPVFRKWWTSLGESDKDNGNNNSDDSDDRDGSIEQTSSNKGERDADKLNDTAPSPATAIPGDDDRSSQETEAAMEKAADGYWNEYYRPHQYTSFDTLFVGSLNSSASLHTGTDIQNIPSPFADRNSNTRRRSAASGRQRMRSMQREPKWLKSELDEHQDPTRVSRQEIYERVRAKTTATPAPQSMSVGGWLTDGISAPLQEPQVGQAEVEEYEKYVHQFDDLQKWIVPPSTLLYTDYLKSRASAPSLQIDTSAESIHSFYNERRSQTPTPSGSGYPLSGPQSAQPLQGHHHHLRRLLGTYSSLSPTADQPHSQPHSQPRQRSNTASERGSLWRLWPYHQQQDSEDEQQQQQQPPPMEPRLPLSAGLPQTPLQRIRSSGRFAHDRSRSLDLGNMDSARTSTVLGQSSHELSDSNPGMIAEPRVAEADLSIYQSYVRMRKAMDGGDCVA
ncbi:phosphatidylinositol-3,5-bisphosphate 5-phosphatase [Coemansia sp. RSA 552]|nr:phosphatidylinositol-3,5-bisphosphate 5-phosphatase [Coemansia sp. RSA 552]